MPGQKEIKDVDIKTSDGDMNLTKCRFIDSMLDRAKTNDSGGESRDQTFARMDIMQKYYDDGGMHKFKRHAQHRARNVTNKCYSIVEGALPIIVDNKPKAEMAPGAVDDTGIVAQLKQVYDAKHNDLDLGMKTTLAVKSALIRSEGYWKIFWNPLLHGGLGDVDVQIVDPKRIFVVGGSDPLMKDAFAIMYHGPQTIGELQAWYPTKAAAINKEWAAIGGAIDIEEKAVPDFYSNHRSVSDDGTGDVQPWFNAEGEGASGTEQMMFTEMWIDDKTLVKQVKDWLVVALEPGQGDEGTMFKVMAEDTPENVQRIEEQGFEYDVINGNDLDKIGLTNRQKMLRKYPFGRIMAKTGRLLLEDKASLYTHGRHPYVRFFVCPVPGKNYFKGELDQLINIQDTFNKRNSQITDILSLTANPPMLVNIMSGIKPKKMTNEAGLIIPVNTKPADAAQWLHTPNIPSALFADVQRINDDFDSISGYHDITAGRKPAGITAGVAIDSLQEASQTRYRQKARYIEYSLKDAAEKLISIIYQFYKEPRTVRTEDADAPGGYKFEEVNFSNTKLVGGLPDIKIKAGSTMQRNKAALFRQAMELYQMISASSPAAGMVFLEQVLKVGNWPDAEGTYKAILEAAKGEQQQVTQ